MKKFTAWHLLIFMIMIYAVFFFVSPYIFWSSFNFFEKIIIKILPIFALVFALMVVVNRYMSNQFIIKHMRGNKIKSWFYIIIGGILSTGPIYMWYPLLKDLRDKGISNGEIACFLYNRSIKPAFLPLIILYFGLKYVAILTLVMIAMSIVQAVIIEKTAPYQKMEYK
ncbi:MAG: hypothetical protein GWO79_00525 [Actinobacteria bacterium]|nr:hypothetical protein [Actinomycetota bacterium]